MQYEVSSIITANNMQYNILFLSSGCFDVKKYIEKISLGIKINRNCIEYVYQTVLARKILIQISAIKVACECRIKIEFYPASKYYK